MLQTQIERKIQLDEALEFCDNAENILVSPFSLLLVSELILYFDLALYL
jgi:hypothetical protein